MKRHQILGLLHFLFFLHSSLPFASPLCPPDQRDSLLHFKNSSVLDVKASDYCHSSYPSYPKTNLWNKDVDCCLWDGVTCENVTGNVIGLDLTCNWLGDALYSNSSLLLPKLEVLLLRSCNLTRFPYFLNSLKGLKDLDLSFNMISGEIPEWFSGTSHDTLEKLIISHNLLNGSIQQLHRKQLFYIDLEKNLFQGPLPIPPPSTSYFYASDNDFTGEIPSSICKLSSLKLLDLSKNSLSGYMPPCFGNITNLVDLDLSNNKLQGPLPRSLVKCANLSVLLLNHNEFSDIFPHWLGVPQLYLLDLQSNNFHGRINLRALKLSFPALAYLFLSNNNFIGWSSMEDFSNTSLLVIDLSNNKFGGPFLLPSPVTSYYSIASNNFAGKIPSLICNATEVEMIDLSNNSLMGSLPPCITNFGTRLSILNLGMNNLEGTIPQSFSSGNSLMTLDLSQNRFEGKLPQSLEKCGFLEVLDLSDNRIKDTFPRWLGILPQLKVLILRSNHFEGFLDIPRQIDLFPKLKMLDLSNNNFGGPLPANLIMNLKAMMNGNDELESPLYMTQYFEKSSYDNFVIVALKGYGLTLMKIRTRLTIIDLSYNSFEGDIPEVIGHLNFLNGLNLSHNHLIGSIPPTLGNMVNLEWLDVSSNKLCGGIPTALENLTFLEFLNLSNNQLIGRIPQGNQWATFESDSFIGNPGLCGTPFPKECSPGLSSSTFNCKGHEIWFKQNTVWIGYSSGIVIGISIAYIAVEIGRPRWLAQGVRMLERKAAEWMEKPKQKVIKFYGQ
ncbi:hypothetical protein BT93_L2486 [Corymbia citriodora subsp. variegata]|uniref:Leucine-rich repeat-containing N-terminal plant-type domain-containing protein n=1 Tax=Corymbia citriodora subsp. variegata TaxID=360336 RepID=A0A8T0CJM6_CORYI|nr:hypothetical protein BT93_L2486 [Corymbia citriodora subsp. variegata]